MPLVKKLAFAPLFLLLVAFLSIQINPVLKDYSLIFSLSGEALLQYGGLVLILMLVSFTYIVFCSLTQDIKMVIPVALLGSLMPLVLINSSQSYIVSIGFFLSLSLVGAMLINRLKSYLTFQPTVLFSSPIKNLTGILIVITSLTFFFSISKVISEKGFEVPDSLIDSVMPLLNSSLNSNQLVKGERYLAQVPQLTPENIEYLKAHPELLKQYNIDPKVLNSLSTQPKSTTTNGGAKSVPLTSLVTKELIKSQVNNILKPFEKWIPFVLASLFFSLLMSFNWIISFFVSPLLYLTFLALEKSGYIHFEKEMREVKKMVV